MKIKGNIMQIQGAKKGAGSGKKPYIAKDTAASTNFYHGLYGLSEGEIAGLVDGGRSIELDGTPLINANGQPNFDNVWWDFRTGTHDQSYIQGFGSVNNEINVGVELRHDRPFTRALDNTSLDAIIIRLAWSALREQKDNGDIVGYKIDYAIDVQTDGGAYIEVLSTTIHDKVAQGYQRSHRIDLPKARHGWVIRVRRLTPNRDHEMISDKMSVSAVTEVIDAKLRYPHTALLALRYDAETFGNIAKLAVHCRGLLIQVPTNYDPDTRTYHGMWDGTFKLAYSNNPAWVLYDICTAKRYGLGERLAGKVDKWSLYRLAQYCDELVDDGKGGKEPRFTCNVYIQKAEQAFSILQSLSSIFRGMIFWDGVQIMTDADVPKDPVYTFSRANVADGEFIYTGSRARDRHTVVEVAYDDPDNDYKTDYELVRDDHAIARYGVNILELNAFGCTSQGQARRAGVWALKTEQLETQSISFKTGLDGFIPKIGDVINIADNVRAGRGIAGRIIAVDGRTISLDRPAGNVGDSFIVHHHKARVTKVNGRIITLDKAIQASIDDIWAIVSDELHLATYRVMSITSADESSFNITAIEYNPQKYSISDAGARIAPNRISVIRPNILDAPDQVVITSAHRVVQGQSVTTLTIGWTQVATAVAYIVQWRKDDGVWMTLPKVASTSIDIDGVYSGNYMARVCALDAFDNQSLTTTSALTPITGKVGKPPTLARLTVTGTLFGMRLDWAFSTGSGDTAYTQIQVSPDGVANIAPVGDFAYPTSTHQVQGLQGGLTQYYRARIADKLGNVSDWTEWVVGTTDDDAAKVLDLLSGQISQSHLDQSLRIPIDKIDTLEMGLTDATSKLNTIEIAQDKQADKITHIESALQSVNATAISQLSTKVDEIDGKYSTTSTALTTLQSTVDEHTTSLQVQGQVIDGLKGEYTIKVDSSGRVAGIGLYGDKTTSAFAVQADQFYIAPPSGGVGVSPFVVLTSPSYIDGVRVPAGTYIRSAHIHNGAITNAKIGHGAITSAKIADAAITSAKIGTAQIDTLNIRGNAVTVPRVRDHSGHKDWSGGVALAHKNITDSLSIQTSGGMVMVHVSIGVIQLYWTGMMRTGKFFPSRIDNAFYVKPPPVPEGGLSNVEHVDLGPGVRWWANPDDFILLRIRRNGVDLKEYRFNMNWAGARHDAGWQYDHHNWRRHVGVYKEMLSFVFSDNPPSGQHSYEIYIASTVDYENVFTKDIVLYVHEFKR